MGCKSNKLTTSCKDHIVSFSTRTELSGDMEAGETISCDCPCIIKKFKTGSTDNAKQQGRPRVILQRETYQLVHEASKKPRISETSCFNFGKDCYTSNNPESSP